ncbi:MAG TPA: universal stress protein [Chloroflexota bacterium]|nr:universal stress protein [Chloroflexota bacterium]
MIRQGTITIALDGSPAAAAAFPVAEALAKQAGLEIEALHVAVDRSALREPSPLRYVAPASANAVRLRVVEGDPAVQLLAAAADPRVALLVLTTHGGEIRDGGILSPISLMVAARAARPVLFIPPEIADHGGATNAVERVLVPLDGARATAAALAPSMELMERLRMRADLSFDVLFVFHPGGRASSVEDMAGPMYLDQPHHEWPGWKRRAAAWLRRSCPQLPIDAPLHIFASGVHTRAEVARVIAEFGARQRADLVLAVRTSAMQRGSGEVLRGVLRLAPCPVLLVPAAEQTTKGVGS